MALSKIQSLDFRNQLIAVKESIQHLAMDLVSLGERYVVPVAREHRVLVSVALVLLAGRVYYWHKFSFWSRRGIKTPKPIPVFGNFLAFVTNYRQRLELEWPKKFGKVYGFYQGASPYLVIADAEIFKRICIKDFTSFPNHRMFPVPNKYQKHFLLLQKDNHWRGMRAILTPTFSSGRIKVMYKLMVDSADDLCLEHKRLVESGSDEFDTRDFYGPFTMSSALKGFYGLNLSLNSNLQEEKQTGSGDQLTAATFAKNSREAFSLGMFRFALTNLLPPKLLDLVGLHSASEGKFDFFAKSVKMIIQQRRQAKSKSNDYLQLLLEARADAEIKRTTNEKCEDHHAEGIDSQSDNWRPSQMTLTETEVQCQAMMLMMVATETTRLLISHVVYLLANHQDIQTRLHQEVVRISKSEQRENGQIIRTFAYEDLISCEYLDNVVSETLRLMSPVVAMDRVANEDYYIKEYDVTVPKGTILIMSIYAIMNDPDYWPEPSKFDPERFSSENKHKIVPGSYVPFGIGPRACIGFRFALAEAKVYLAKVLCDFRFEPALGAKYPPDPTKPVFIQNDFHDVRVKILKRA